MRMSDPLRTFSPLRCHCLTSFHEDERSSSDELVDIVCPKPVPAIVGAALLDAREHIVESDRFAIWIDIDHGAIHLEQRDHLVYVRINHEGMGLAGRFIGIGALRRNPVVLKVAPLTLKHEGMDGLRVPVA
jgi:hypothetical protein